MCGQQGCFDFWRTCDSSWVSLSLSLFLSEWMQNWGTPCGHAAWWECKILDGLVASCKVDVLQRLGSMKIFLATPDFQAKVEFFFLIGGGFLSSLFWVFCILHPTLSIEATGMTAMSRWRWEGVQTPVFAHGLLNVSLWSIEKAGQGSKEMLYPLSQP